MTSVYKIEDFASYIPDSERWENDWKTRKEEPK